MGYDGGTIALPRVADRRSQSVAMHLDGTSGPRGTATRRVAVTSRRAFFRMAAGALAAPYIPPLIALSCTPHPNNPVSPPHALSEEALEDMIVEMHNATDARGLFIRQTVGLCTVIAPLQVAVNGAYASLIRDRDVWIIDAEGLS